MKSFSIMGVLLDNRTNIAPKVQEVFTKHGEMIVARLGMHDPDEKNTGLITLNLIASEKEINQLSNELSSLDGVVVKHVIMK